jgi:hypothetical protein
MAYLQVYDTWKQGQNHSLSVEWEVWFLDVGAAVPTSVHSFHRYSNRQQIIPIATKHKRHFINHTWTLSVLRSKIERLNRERQYMNSRGMCIQLFYGPSGCKIASLLHCSLAFLDYQMCYSVTVRKKICSHTCIILNSVPTENFMISWSRKLFLFSNMNYNILIYKRDVYVLCRFEYFYSNSKHIKLKEIHFL